MHWNRSNVLLLRNGLFQKREYTSYVLYAETIADIALIIYVYEISYIAVMGRAQNSFSLMKPCLKASMKQEVTWIKLSSSGSLKLIAYHK